MPHDFVKPEYLEKLKQLCLFDDILMRKAFENDIPATELLLHILLDNDKIKVEKVITQYSITNLIGHSVQLDVLAKNELGQYINVEVQSNKEGAAPQRARYNVGLIDSAHFPKREDYRKLFDTYVIFITKEDVLNEGRPIYHIERIIEEAGNYFNDGAHIIYVNGENCDSSTILGKLMHDFNCTNPNEMYFDILKRNLKYYKESEEGVQTMCSVMEDLKKQGQIEGEDRLALLLQKLYSLGRTEDAQRALKDKPFRHSLMKEFAM